MVDQVSASKNGKSDALQAIAKAAPGLALSAIVAVASLAAEPLLAAVLKSATGRAITLPAVVIALLIGMALNRIAQRPLHAPGITFAVKKLLRVAIALLGFRIALGDIAGLGLGAAVLVVVAMAATVVSGFLFARLLGRDAAYGALAGGATAVCGASAALATATVLPPDPKRDADTVFMVVAVNALSTVAMLGYPIIGAALGYDDLTMGIFLGATIHDVAQVVGAGYSVSDAAGAPAVVVKLFRVFLLLPVVLGIGWWFASRGGGADKAKVPVPVFAIVFLVFALANSAGIVPESLRAVAGEASRWGLLIAIAALGLGTSVKAVAAVGWRHIAVVCGTTLVILGVVVAGLGIRG